MAIVTLDNWYSRMSEDLRLRDYRPKTQQAYLLSTKLLVRWLRREPATWTEQDVRRYFLYLRDEKKSSPSTIHVAVCGIRFFVAHTLGQDWPVLELMRVRRPKRLPVVLSRTEVRCVLSAVRHPVRRMALTTIYGLGLRLGEALRLQTDHIDAERRTVWVRDGKGAKDRGVMLPRPLLERLRRYWKQDRPPAQTSHLFISETTGRPPDPTTLEKTFAATCREVGLERRAWIHTLRHSYATHLLESGITVPTIQRLLGHRAMQTTMVYMHVTQASTERLQATLDELVADL